MSRTIFPYNPTGQAPVTFQPTLDGQQYNAIITSSLFGQRPMLNLYSLSNELIVCEALEGSPNPKPLQSVTWANGLATATALNPHGFKVGQVVTLTIADMVPDTYNGLFQCLIRSPLTFTYPIANDPGTVTSVGSLAQNLNLVGAYFTESSLVYRVAAQQIEVSP